MVEKMKHEHGCEVFCQVLGGVVVVGGLMMTCTHAHTGFHSPTPPLSISLFMSALLSFSFSSMF